MTEVKKVIQRIYEFNLSNSSLFDKQEIITTDAGNEFTNTFIKRDFDKGIIVTPSGYSRGLVYRSIDGGMFYAPAIWYPDIISFNFNLYGLKKNTFYRITVKAKNMSKYNNLTDITDDRTIKVITDDQMLLIDSDLSNEMDYKSLEGIFRATSIEENLSFRIGKIGINDIIIDEVEIASDSVSENKDEKDVEFETGKSNIVAYAVFMPTKEDSNKRYLEIPRITGKGLNLYFDKTTNEYILERDNYEDSIGVSFTNANYTVDFVFTKAPYASYQIVDVSNDVSPNTLRQGFIKFNILDSGKIGKYTRENGRLAFIVNKIL